MSCFSRTFLAASVSAALFMPQTQAESMPDASVQDLPTTDQCLINEPEPENPTQQPIKVEADSLEAINGDKAVYNGNVVVTQGKKRISASRVTLHQQENVVVAEGDVKFNDGQFKTVSDKATNNLTTEQITLENTKYKFLCEPGRGEAVYIAKTGKAVYEIQDGSLTSCPEDDDSWRLVASSIDVDQDQDEATFYNPRFEIQNVPVFYLPFLTVPIGDARKTGFLYPTVSYGSSDGYEFEIPVYWNIAPNLDLQTTVKYMDKRGTQLNSKFRYLTELGQGSLTTEYLPDDAKYSDKGERWGLQYQHSGIYDKAWKFNVDYAKVSDIDYFTDLSSSIGNREDGQLMQEAQIQYRTNSWDASLQTRDFQVLTSSGNKPYQLLPQLDFNYYAPELMRYLDFDLKSKISRFETQDGSKPSATRVHVEPGLKIPLGTTWGSWTTEARLLNTYYHQDLDGVDLSSSTYDGYDLESNVSRVIPEFRSHAGIVLERDTVVLDSYTQTLEPQIQYLYVPKTDQSDIYLYDTTLLQSDYYGLFRSRRYSSVDRIAPANQFSYGASTRFFDSAYRERLSFSFGQIFYIDQEYKDTSGTDTETHGSNYSALAAEMDFNYDDYLFYHGGIQYDVDSNAIQFGNSTLEYRFDSGYVQANYRYVTKEYIAETVDLDLDALTEDGISQAGLLTSYQISRKWQFNGQYFHDLTTNQDLEWVAGLRYTSDCWYIGFSYSNRLKDWDPSFNQYPDADANYEHDFSFNFGIIGFGTNVGTESSSSNSLGYGRPFTLNN